MSIAVSDARAIEIANQGLQNNPFVAWNNLGATATLGGTTVIAGGEAANAVTGSTYDKWRPIAGGTTRTLTFDLGAVASVGFASIAAHNAFTLGASVVVEYSADGVTWFDSGAGSITPTDNSPMSWRFAATSARYWRFVFSGIATDGLLAVGVAFIGAELIIPERMYQGFSPVLTPTEVQLQSNVSIGNELLGTSIIGRGATLSASLTYIPSAFIRGADWLSFQTAFGEGKGFLFAWRPAKYPEDLHYCSRESGVIRPSNTGPRDLMDINFSARVYANG